MVDQIRLGLIGCGRIAQVAHLPAIDKAEGIEVVALCDGNASVADAVAQRHGISTVHATSDALIADPGVDAVLIAIPDRFHRSVAGAALEAGKHVLIEKPLAASTEECLQLIDLVERTGLTLQVGAMKRHDAGIQYAHDFVQGPLGELRSFHAWYRIGDLRPGIEHTLFPKVYAEEATTKMETALKGDREQYLLATHGSHIFDTVRFLAGPIVAIDARHSGFGRDHMWSALVQVESGIWGTVTITVDVPGVPSEGIELLGSAGTIRADIPFPFTKTASRVHAYFDGKVIEPVLTDGDPYERQAEDFAAAIREGYGAVPNALDGLAAVKAIEATAASVARGQQVAL